MPDYIYLLENRLSVDQRNALRSLRTVAAEAGLILFLIGDAVRDLTSGHAVRDIEVAIQGNALKLKKAIEKAGGKVWGEDEVSRTLYLCFPGTVRIDLISTHRAEYPKPGKPVLHWASIQEDLRRRDFTANAMAISLNEGSYGLLMDPLNGAADIEARALRLVSNYGFLEEPALLIRAARYKARLGWEMDARTQARYDNAREEGVIEALSAHARSEELEQIGHEEDGLKVLQALETEGWMKVLYPAWTVAKADTEGLKALHDLAVELLMQGVHPDMSAAQMHLLTAKLGGKDLSALKKLMLRPGFVEEWNSLDSLAAGFAKALNAKDNQIPSHGFKLFMSYDPEAILWLGFTTKDASIRERYNIFLKVWPEARQRIPYTLMQEMRITPDLPTYNHIVEAVFLELIDGRLLTPEEARAFLEPHSPPAPPPQVTIKRTRARRGAEPRVKEPAADEDEEGAEDEEMEVMGGDDEEMDLGLPKSALDSDMEESEGDDEEEEEESESEESDEEPAPKRGAKGAAGKAGKAAPAAKAEKSAAASRPAGKTGVPAGKPAAPPATAAGSKPTPPAKPAPQTSAPAKPSAPPAKPLPAAAAAAKPAAPLAKPKPGAPAPVAKVQAPPPAKHAITPAKAGKPAPPAKAAPKPAPAKVPAKSVGAKAAVKPAAKAPAAKPAPAKAKPAAGSAGKTAKPAKPTAKTAKPSPKKPAKKR